MNEMINLQEFCNREQEYFGKPFSVGKYTYATDQVIVIRIPRVEGFSENKVFPNVVTIFKNLPSVKNFIDIPAYENHEIFCKECMGEGSISECLKCGGTGKVDCFECGQSMDCKDCDGTGKVPNGPKECDVCGGTGTMIASQYIEISNGVDVSSYYLELLKGLPNIKLSDECQNWMVPVYFKFDGGDGLLMPLKAFNRQTLENKRN